MKLHRLSAKQTAGLVTALMVAGLAFTGCGSASGQAADTSAQSQTVAPAAGNNATNNAPDAHRGQFRGNAISGEITAVTGNQVTLKLIQMGGRGPQGNGNGPAASAAPASPAAENGQARGQITYTGESRTITLPDTVEITETGRGSFGGGRNGQGPGSQDSKSSPQAPSASSAPGSAGSAPAGKPQIQTLKLSDLKAGMVLQVWSDESDSSKITRVTVMNAGNGTPPSASAAPAGNAK